VSSSARMRWLIIVALVTVDAVGLTHSGMRLDALGLGRGVASILFLVALAAFYTFKRPDPRVVDLAHTGAQLLAFFAVSGVMSYLITSTTLPLVDQEFAAADHALGFDWPAWFAGLQQFPWLLVVLKLAYMSALTQLIAITVYLALSGQAERNAEFFWSIILSLLVILPISGLLPAAGAFAYYDVTRLTGGAPPPNFVIEFLAVRAGALHVLDLTRMEGLISFPSFHTALGVLFVYALRGRTIVFGSAALLNVLMILAVPSEGGHYLVDVISGAAVAALAIWGAHQIEARLRALPAEPAIASVGR
jgi:membrane-associated phospholipid phosphatase